MDPAAVLPKKRHRYLEQMRNPNLVSNPGRVPFLFHIPRLNPTNIETRDHESLQIQPDDEHIAPIQETQLNAANLIVCTVNDESTGPTMDTCELQPLQRMDAFEVDRPSDLESNTNLDEPTKPSRPESPLMVDPSQLVCPLNSNDVFVAPNESTYTDMPVNAKTPTYYCEWKNCPCNTFDDLTRFLAHLRVHLREIRELVDIEPEPFNCMWSECNEQFAAEQIDDFYLHLTYHGYHSKLMSNGALELRFLSERIGRSIQCYMDSSSRTLLPGLPDSFVCGWKSCLTSFSDAESFYRHVGRHPFEDVKIPAVSKEQLRRTRFAECLWNECKAAFNSRSRLRDHLRSHTQEKTVACPNCGSMFFNRVKFHDHLFRQMCNEEEQRQLETLLLHVSLPDDERLTLTLISKVPKSSAQQHTATNESSVEDESSAQKLQSEKTTATEGITPNDAESVDRQTPNNDSDDSNCPRLTIEQFVERNTTQYDPEHNDNENTSVDIYRVHNPDANISIVDSMNLESASPRKLTLRASTRKQAEQNSTSKAKRPFPAHDCPHCEKSLPTSSLLTEHLRTHRAHWKCNVCGYRTNSYSSLTHHVVYRHSNLRPFACQFCEAKFKSRSDLRKHIDIHSDDHPYKCPQCSFKCRCCHTLAKHRKKEHEEAESVYQCQLCRRTFTRGNNLSRHLSRSHQFPLPEGRTRFTYKRDDDGVYRLSSLNQIIE